MYMCNGFRSRGTGWGDHHTITGPRRLLLGCAGEGRGAASRCVFLRARAWAQLPLLPGWSSLGCWWGPPPQRAARSQTLTGLAT